MADVACRVIGLGRKDIDAVGDRRGIPAEVVGGGTVTYLEHTVQVEFDLGNADVVTRAGGHRNRACRRTVVHRGDDGDDRCGRVVEHRDGDVGRLADVACSVIGLGRKSIDAVGDRRGIPAEVIGGGAVAHLQGAVYIELHLGNADVVARVGRNRKGACRRTVVHRGGKGDDRGSRVVEHRDRDGRRLTDVACRVIGLGRKSIDAVGDCRGVPIEAVWCATYGRLQGAVQIKFDLGNADVVARVGGNQNRTCRRAVVHRRGHGDDRRGCVVEHRDRDVRRLADVACRVIGLGRKGIDAVGDRRGVPAEAVGGGAVAHLQGAVYIELHLGNADVVARACGNRNRACRRTVVHRRADGDDRRGRVVGHRDRDIRRLADVACRVIGLGRKGIDAVGDRRGVPAEAVGGGAVAHLQGAVYIELHLGNADVVARACGNRNRACRRTVVHRRADGDDRRGRVVGHRDRDIRRLADVACRVIGLGRKGIDAVGDRRGVPAEAVGGGAVAYLQSAVYIELNLDNGSVIGGVSADHCCPADGGIVCRSTQCHARSSSICCHIVKGRHLHHPGT